MAEKWRNRLADFRGAEEGATASEYAVMLALIIAVVFATVLLLGGRVEQGFNYFLTLYQNQLN